MRNIFRITTIALILVMIIQVSCGTSGKKQSDQSDSLKLSVMKTHFGNVDGREVFLYTLTNKHGITVKITGYGGIITQILTPDKNGKTGDIVLGYDTLGGYLKATPYFGAIVGRYANRIAKGTFTLDGRTYHLAINNGNNSLHGGIKGFDKVVWDSKEFEDSTGAGVILTYLSRDGEEGYPGNLSVKVIYTLDDRDELKTEIQAETDKATPVNLCNHTYFNLSCGDTSILGHVLTIHADRYTEVNEELIPTGKLPLVAGTPMDFGYPYLIGARIDYVPGGYDHNYVLRKKEGELAPAAKVYDPGSGRQVDILTTQPGIQFYSGNFLDGTITGINGKVYKKHWGLCLETQHFPDSPNHPEFPNTILRPGETFDQVTLYRFSVVK